MNVNRHSCGARLLQGIDRRRQGHAASLDIHPFGHASEPRGHSRLPVPSPWSRADARFEEPS